MKIKLLCLGLAMMCSSLFIGLVLHAMQQEAKPSKSYFSLLPTELQSELAKRFYVNDIRFWAMRAINPLPVPFQAQGSKDAIVSDINKKGDKLAIANADHSISLYDIESKAEIKLIGHTAQITSGHFCENRFLSTAQDHTLRIWDIDTGNEILQIMNPEDNIKFGHILEKQRMVYGVTDYYLKIWDIDTKKVTALFKDPVKGSAREIIIEVMNDQGTKAAAVFLNEDDMTDSIIYLWDRTGKITPLQGHTKPIFSINFDESGQRLISASNEKIVRMWDVNTGKEIASFEHPDDVSYANFNHQGDKIITACNDKQIRIWKINGKELITSINFSGQDVQLVGPNFSHDDQIIFVLLTDGQMFYLDAHDGTPLRSLAVPGQLLFPLGDDAEDKVLLVSTDELPLTDDSLLNIDVLNFYDLKYARQYDKDISLLDYLFNRLSLTECALLREIRYATYQDAQVDLTKRPESLLIFNNLPDVIKIPMLPHVILKEE